MSRNDSCFDVYASISDENLAVSDGEMHAFCRQSPPAVSSKIFLGQVEDPKAQEQVHQAAPYRLDL